MDEINQKEFENMFGTESIDRSNYIDLLEQIKLNINSNAVVGLLMMRLSQDAKEMIDSMGVKDGVDTITKVLKIITTIHLLLAKDLAQKHVKQHHLKLYNDEMEVEDFLQDSSLDVTRAHLTKVVGFDVMMMLDIWPGNSDESER